MRLCVSVISGGQVKPQTISSIITSFNDLTCEKHLIFPVGGYPDHNRNLSVKMARESHSSHLMFIDQDMQFPRDGIKKLIELNKSICGANYNQRGMPLTSTMKIEVDGKLYSGGLEFPNEPFTVYALGTGFMLIDMDVFNNLEFPWFQVVEDPDPKEFTTEDVYFCKQAGKKYEIWCDPSIKVGHIGEYVY
jgi:hypothetical protein